MARFFRGRGTGGGALPRGGHPAVMACCWLLVVFFVLFPKGGVRAGPIPLTWGYMLLALMTPFAAVVRLLVLPDPLRMPRGAWIGLACLVPFNLCMLYATLAHGVVEAGGAAGVYFSALVLPVVFLALFGPYLRLVDGATLGRLLRWCILLAALWGLLLFGLHPLTGHFLEIKYLTVNASDYGRIEATKNIARGYFFKLISTYNNGNVYGAATLILLPMYEWLEDVRLKRGVVKLALLLTLSRSVWLVLLVNEMVPLAARLAGEVRKFPVLRVRRVRKQLGAVLVLVVLVAGGTLLTTGVSRRFFSFLFDPTAGGRFASGGAAMQISLLPSQGAGPLSEVVYRSALAMLGVAGLLSVVLLLASPVLAVLSDRRYLRDGMRRAALRGLLLYAVMAAADGAFVLIPVMVFYWFAFAVLVYGWPQRQGLALTEPA